MPFYKVLSYIHVHNIRNGSDTEWRFAEGGKKAISKKAFKKALQS